MECVPLLSFFPDGIQGRRAPFEPNSHRVMSRVLMGTRTLVLVAGFPAKSPTAALTTGW